MNNVGYDGVKFVQSNGVGVNALTQNLALTGNLTLTGNSTVSGNVTMSGKVIKDGTTSTSGAGAVALTGSTHEVTTTGTGDALTLADGTVGQEITVLYVAEGAGSDTAVITPANFLNGTTVTLNAIADLVTFKFRTGGWYVTDLIGTAAIA